MTINDMLLELVEAFVSVDAIAALAEEDVSDLSGADIKESLKLLGVNLAKVIVEIQNGGK